MKLKKFKERSNKRIGIIIFTITCIFLVGGIALYRTFAIFEVKINQNVIKGTVQDPGNLYFAFYQKNEENGTYEIQKDMPDKNSGYVLDEEASYCGVSGDEDTKIKVSLTEDWVVHVSGITTSRTKCNLYFTKGIFLMGHGVPVVTSGDGLYEIKHENVQNTLNDDGFGETEYRFAGENPKNYVTFNNEKWRIIGFVNVLVPQVDGKNKVEQRIKLIKDENIGNYAWDSKKSGISSSKSDYGSNDWTDSELMQYLNGEYYLNLHDSAKNFIDENIVWNIGGIKDININTNTSILEIYQHERGTTVDSERKVEWNKENTIGVTFHSIGLMYPSDYGFATTGGNLGRESCLSLDLFAKDTTWNLECANNTWFRKDTYYKWTITPYNDERTSVVATLYNEKGFFHYTNFTDFLVYPVVYLKQNVKIISGIGSSVDAFEIAQVIKN